MKIIITEEQYKRFMKSSPALQNAITKYLNQYIEGGQRKITIVLSQEKLHFRYATATQPYSFE